MPKSNYSPAVSGGTYACGTCGGGGLVPATDCRCKNGNIHTCSPRTCPACNGAGWKSATDPYKPRGRR